ncbi:MAG: hypothetical protein P8X86_02185 [Desulfofustis sp.]|jgi:hypothetical protein
MIVGVLKEIKVKEKRVSMTQAGAQAMTESEEIKKGGNVINGLLT